MYFKSVVMLNMAMTQLWLFHSGPKCELVHNFHSNVQLIKASVQVCFLALCLLYRAIHTSSMKHRVRTRNKVTELQEYHTGNYWGSYRNTHSQASDICRQLVPRQLAANWIIVWKGERRSEQWREEKRERGKMAGEQKQKINETNSSQKTSGEGETHQG